MPLPLSAQSPILFVNDSSSTPAKGTYQLKCYRFIRASPNRHEFLYLKGFATNDLEPDDDQRSFKTLMIKDTHRARFRCIIIELLPFKNT